tara:strand:+ start:228 stop:464 length:237 start_codon:yes stop_codon:yes gene_type:complete
MTTSQILMLCDAAMHPKAGHRAKDSALWVNNRQWLVDNGYIHNKNTQGRFFITDKGQAVVSQLAHLSGELSHNLQKVK